MSESDADAGRSVLRKKPPLVAGCMLFVFIGIGALGAVAIAVDWVRGLQTWFWEETLCTIESSSAVARPESGDHVFEVSYRFSWDGAEHAGTSLRPGYSGSDEYEARMLASRYRVGSDTQCWIDTEDPSRSALERSNLWEGLWIFLPLLFVAVGFGALWILRSFRETEMEASPASGEGNDTEPRWTPNSPFADSRPLKKGAGALKSAVVLAGFFGVFFLVGTGFLLPFFIWPALKVVDARSWQEVPCEILESSVRTHSGDDGNTYSIEVLFRYQIEGRDYLSNRYHFLGGSTGGYDAKARIVEGIPPGARTACYVDPDAPHEAVLQRGFSGEFMFAVIPFLFMLVGAGGVYWVVTGARKTRQLATGPSWTAPPRLEDPTRARSAVILEPKLGPFGKVAAAAGVMLIWNGLTSVFVWHLVEAWRLGTRDWFLALFLSPFVLVGLLLLLGVPYQVLALLNPRPRLRLSHEPLRPGESAQIEWSFRGFARRIQTLAISLEAAKTEVTSEGSSVRAESEPVSSLEVARRTRGHGLEFGAVSFTIPERLDDGSPAGDAAVTWKLKLHGDISYWPDVEEEYTLDVIESPSWHWNRQEPGAADA